jgi:uncharacterized membrane protein YecN with MAPEG domain
MPDPTQEQERARRGQRLISSTIWWTAPAVFIGVPLLHFLVVPPPAIETMADRLALAARCSAIAVVPYFLVIIKIMSVRFWSGSHDPLTHAESPALKIDARVLQNHLEQLVAFALVLLGLSTVLGREHLQLLPITTGVFVVARFIYWRGYHRKGTLGRAPGVQLTLFVTLPLLLLTVALVLGQALGR